MIQNSCADEEPFYGTVDINIWAKITIETRIDNNKSVEYQIHHNGRLVHNTSYDMPVLPNTNMKLYIGDNAIKPANVKIRNLQYSENEEIVETWGPTYTVGFGLKGLVKIVLYQPTCIWCIFF